MVEFFLGGLITSGFILFYSHTRKNGMKISIFQWMIIIAAFVYLSFVSATVVEFVEEGTFKGAAVIGCIMGFAAVIWGILINRFILTKSTKKK